MVIFFNHSHGSFLSLKTNTPKTTSKSKISGSLSPEEQRAQMPNLGPCTPCRLPSQRSPEQPSPRSRHLIFQPRIICCLPLHPGTVTAPHRGCSPLPSPAWTCVLCAGRSRRGQCSLTVSARHAGARVFPSTLGFSLLEDIDPVAFILGFYDKSEFRDCLLN